MPKHKDKTKHLQKAEKMETDSEPRENPPQRLTPKRPIFGKKKRGASSSSTRDGPSTSRGPQEPEDYAREIFEHVSRLNTPEEVEKYLKETQELRGGKDILKAMFVKKARTLTEEEMAEIAPFEKIPPSTQPILPGNPEDIIIKMNENSQPEFLTLLQVYHRAVNMTLAERTKYLDYFNFELLRNEYTGQINGLRTDTHLKDVPTRPHVDVFTISTSSGQVLRSPAGPSSQQPSSSQQPRHSRTPQSPPRKSTSRKPEEEFSLLDLSHLPREGTMPRPPNYYLPPVQTYDLTGLRAQPPPDALTSAYYSAQNYVMETYSNASFVITGGYFLAFFIFFLNLITYCMTADDQREEEERSAERRRAQEAAAAARQRAPPRPPLSRAEQRAQRRKQARGSNRKRR